MPNFKLTKSIKSRYSKKIINNNYFGNVNISGNTYNTHTTKDGYIYAPYIMISTGTIISEYETSEQKAERIKEERRKKLERIFKK